MAEQTYMPSRKNDQKTEHQPQHRTYSQSIYLTDIFRDRHYPDDITADGCKQCIGRKDLCLHQRDIHGVGISDDGIDSDNLRAYMKKNCKCSQDQMRELKYVFLAAIGTGQFSTFMFG